MRRAEPGEERDLLARVGSLEIDWPKAIGYFGGIWLAVAYDVIAPPLGVFIAIIPILKLFKRPDQPRSLRIVSDILEGAAKPVGGDSETTVRLATGPPRGRDDDTPRVRVGQRTARPRRRHRPRQRRASRPRVAARASASP